MTDLDMTTAFYHHLYITSAVSLYITYLIPPDDRFGFHTNFLPSSVLHVRSETLSPQVHIPMERKALIQTIGVVFVTFSGKTWELASSRG